MAVVVNGVLVVDGIKVGKVDGIKDGTVLDLTYDTKKVVVIGKE